MPCRINRRRVWTGRLLLEASLHDSLCFLTLTYDDEHLPNDLSLNKDHYQKFLKRLRKAIHPTKISYYIVGEYGGRTKRPHYHVVLFGFSPEKPDGNIIRPSKHNTETQNLLLKVWPHGNIHVGDVTRQSLSYCAKHLTKGLKNGQYIEEGLIPEFASMSLRPAIGLLAINDLAQWLTTDIGSRVLAETGDIPPTFKTDGRTYTYGRYLTAKIRELAGIHRETSKPHIDALHFERMNQILDENSLEKILNLRKLDRARARHSLSLQETRL